MALVHNGVTTFEDVVNLGVKRVTKILRSRRRVESLLAAISAHTDFGASRLASAHDQLAERLGVRETVGACTESMDTQYEEAIVCLLNKEVSWTVTVLDDGWRD